MAAVAHRLRAIQHGELYRALGYTSVFLYAREEHAFSKSKTSELIGISRESEQLPAIREAFDQGALDWTKAREITKVATPEDEGRWLERAETSTSEDLRDQRRGEPRRVRRGFAFSPEQAARFDQLLAGVQSEARGVSDAEALLILLERGSSGSRGQAPLRRIVINECPTCRLATTVSHEGPVPTPPGQLAAARCSGELHDLREEDNTVKRAIPAAIRRRVLDRDQRCLAPGCRALGGLDVHHEDGWRAGHDPQRMVTLCASHHRERHDGYLSIAGSYPDFRFGGLDQEPYRARHVEFSHENADPTEFSHENADPTEFSHENADPTEFSHENADPTEFSYENADRTEFSHENADRQVREDAIRGLVSLGLKTKEAGSLIQRVLRVDPRTWTVEALLSEALRAA